MSFLDIFKNTPEAKEQKTITIKNFNELATVNDYFRTYLFQVDIVGGGNDFQCQWIANTQTPVMATTVQNVDYMHTQIKQSGKTLPQQWQITVRDDANGQAFNYFQNWRNTIYPNMKNGSPGRYKRIAIVKMAPPSTISILKMYILYGVWPMEISAISLDYESDNISTFGVTLSLDYYKTEGIGTAY